MTLSTFDDLLRAASSQSEPQRLLFVFTSASVPDDASPEQRARFLVGQGGTLTPLMCVDKAPDELASFGALAAEAQQFGQAWNLVFVAALSGAQGRSPSAANIDAALQKMVDAIQSGRIAAFIAFDTQGRPVTFD